MKISNFSKIIGAGVIAASLAVLPLTVSAQAQTRDSAPNSDTNTYNQRSGDVNTTNTNDDFDWGWLGLLGLAGLAGLAGRKRQETVHTPPMNQADLGVRPGADYRH